MNEASPAIAHPTPARSGAQLGLFLPGLGHLLSGRPIAGAGMLALLAVEAWAVVAGAPRLGALLYPGPDQQLAWHAALALVGLVLLPIGLWGVAWALTRPGPGPFPEGVRRFSDHTSGMMGLQLALLLFALCLFTPMLAPFSPDLQQMGPDFAPPSWAHPFGTDKFGRDVLSRVLYGSRISLSIGFIAVAVSATVGTLVGAVAGYAGGWVDSALMWVVDLLISLPRLVLLIAIVGIFRTTGAQSLFLMVGILGFTGWMGVARIVRAQVLSLKEQEFVQAARALGFTPARILARHIVPNALGPVIVYASLAVGATILAEAGLSYLGLGVSPPTSTWGTLVRDGGESIRSAPWMAFFPGIFIVWAVMSFNLIGDGLRDVLDPKLRGR